MKEMLKNRIIIATVCFLFGLGLGLSYSLHSPPTKEVQTAETKDPFEVMRDQMMMQMPDMDSNEIRSREDDQNYYFDIVAKGIDQGKLNVKTSRGQIEISGQIESKEGDDQNQHIYSSTFERSFPIPPNADAGNLKVENANGIMTLKIPKIHH